MTVNDQRKTGVGDASDQERADSGQPTNPANTQGNTPPGADARQSGAGTATATVSDDVETLRRERDEYYDLLLRKTAEFDNYRRRVERERRELTDYATADLLHDVLPLVDDLERALAAAAPETQEAGDPIAALRAYRIGVELIHRQLIELLRKKGVTPIDALGTDFDPHVHQAVTQEPSASHREGEVMAELRRGYKLGDRLLRPAMVKVATRE
jgi:molecular chaperone GrpE